MSVSNRKARPTPKSSSRDRPSPSPSLRSNSRAGDRSPSVTSPSKKEASPSKTAAATSAAVATPPSSDPSAAPAPPPASTEPVQKNVRFSSDAVTAVDVPCDQENPLDVWNVYSPVSYVTRREQRRLEKVRNFRIEELRKCFYALYEVTDSKTKRTVASGSDSSVSKRNRKKTVPTEAELLAAGYTKNSFSCAAFIMSLWPSLAVSRRPPMTVAVQKAIETLFKGTLVCVFNESPQSPVQCLSALRLLRNYEADEGSIAIYNSATSVSTIDGYIPLAFLISVSRGLQEVEKNKV